MFDKKKKVKNVLRDEIVVVRYLRDNSKYTGKHLLAGGLHKDCGKTLTIKRQNGRVYPFLSQEEIESLQVHGNLDDLSYSNEKFWKDPFLEVKLINGDIRLNLKDPIDYIKWRNLQQYPLVISPSLDKIHDVATRRWTFIYNNEDSNADVDEIDTLTEAYTQFGKINNDIKTLSYIYTQLEGKVITPNTKKTTIVGWYKEILQNKTSKFLNIVKDDLLEEKVLIYHAVRAGVITKKNNIYFYEDTRLSNDPKSGSRNEAAEFISLPENNDIKLEIEAKLDNE